MNHEGTKGTKNKEQTGRTVGITAALSLKMTRKVLILRVLCVFVVILFSLVWGIYLWIAQDLPDAAMIGEHLQTPSLRIVDRNGRLLYEDLPETGGRHSVVSLEQIPPALRQATIATEDASFYQNPGVDLTGILRAVWINLTGGETLSGGSTITQQVARNLLLNDGERAERSLRRKLRESLLAWNLARTLSKDEVLGLYFNQMYYGSLAYGVEAASQTFFGKPAAELDLAEAAMLAGLPQAPVYDDPFHYPENAKTRQRVVLGLMEKAGFITAEQRDQAEGEPLVYNPEPFPIRAPHFVMMVREEAQQLVSPEEIYRSGGVTVRTSLDLNWQALAEGAIAHQLERLREAGEKAVSYNVNDAALVALDPSSGEIRAMVGSPDYFDEQISGAVNMALAPRQPGSALKPLIYAAAFDPTQPDPWTPATMLLDVTTNFTTHDGKAYTPANYDELEHGPVLARQALASSLNIPAVLTLQHVGLTRLFDLASALGITTLGDPDRYDLSLALGGGEVNLLELSAAYGAFANGGLKVTPRTILDIHDAQGSLLYAAPKPAQPRALDARTAWLIDDILSDDTARELGFGLNSVLKIDRPAAVKTGTTTNFHDNWTIGYTPALVVGVWAGNADHTAMHDVNGLTGAAPIWHEFIRAALNGQAERSFTRPEGIAQAEVCAFSGMLPGPDCPYRRLEWFIAGTQPVQVDTVFHSVVLDTATGQAANAQTPAPRRITRLALDLPPQAARWARDNHQLVYTPPGPEGDAVLQDPNPAERLAIETPADLSVYVLAPGANTDGQRLRVALAVPQGSSRVSLWIDGQMAVDLPGPDYEFWWPLQPGSHTFQARAVGLQGDALDSAPVRVEVK